MATALKSCDAPLLAMICTSTPRSNASASASATGINENDRVMIGDPNPRYIFGANLSAAWRSFDVSALLQGVGPARCLLSPNEHLVARVEEDQRGVAPDDPVRERAAQGLEEGTGADVDDHRDGLGGAVRLVDEPDHVSEQTGRQVVDHEVAEVLELLGRGAAPDTGHAGDDDQLTGDGTRCDVFHGAHCGAASSGLPEGSNADLIRAAVWGPIPGTAPISSTVAARSFLREPKCRSRLLRRTSPRPRTSSSTLSTIDFERRLRW